MTKAPAIFIGHGSPMNAIEDTPAARGWRGIATRFETPRAVLCVSAHWVTEGVRLTGEAQPRTIHDFGGFPAGLFAVQYRAPGDPALALDIAARLAPFGARTDETWGLDHGTWSVLKWFYPYANVPTIQLSLDVRRTPADRYALGKALAPLREENVLVLGSGNIVHNLRHWRDGAPQPWVAGFDAHIVDRIEAGDHAAVTAYETLPDAAVAAPDWDHFTPLLYVLGASDSEAPHVFNRFMIPGISMTSIAFGLPA
jgi:4,5-DOPA dioxygenase extradiol